MKPVFTSFLCLGLLLAPVLQTQAEVQKNKKKSERIHDVAMNASGALQGLVIDSQGKKLAGAQVTILRNNKNVVTTVTDREGKFQVSNLTTGIYELRSGEGKGVVRLWSEQVAPPAAKSRVLLVNDGKLTARAQAGLLEEARVVDFAVLGLSITSVALSGVALGKDRKTIIVSP